MVKVDWPVVYCLVSSIVVGFIFDSTMVGVTTFLVSFVGLFIEAQFNLRNKK